MVEAVIGENPDNILDLFFLNNTKILSHLTSAPNKHLSDHNIIIIHTTLTEPNKKQKRGKNNVCTLPLSNLNIRLTSEEDWNKYEENLNNLEWNFNEPMTVTERNEDIHKKMYDTAIKIIKLKPDKKSGGNKIPKLIRKAMRERQAITKKRMKTRNINDY